MSSKFGPRQRFGKRRIKTASPLLLPPRQPRPAALKGFGRRAAGGAGANRGRYSRRGASLECRVRERSLRSFDGLWSLNEAVVVGRLVRECIRGGWGPHTDPSPAQWRSVPRLKCVGPRGGAERPPNRAGTEGHYVYRRINTFSFQDKPRCGCFGVSLSRCRIKRRQTSCFLVKGFPCVRVRVCVLLYHPWSFCNRINPFSKIVKFELCVGARVSKNVYAKCFIVQSLEFDENGQFFD